MTLTHGPGTTRIGMIVTRDLEEPVSRANTLRGVHSALSADSTVTVHRLQSILERRSLGGVLSALTYGLRSLLHGRPAPLQSILYADSTQFRELLRQVVAAGCDAIYLDTVRCGHLSAYLASTLKDTPMIVDFDDLMSRRAKFLSQNSFPFTLGFLEKHSPVGIRRLLSVRSVSRAVALYEARTLPAFERDMVARCAATVLVSDVESGQLAATLPADKASTVRALPPPAKIRVDHVGQLQPPYRFVFVGSDRQLQNEMSIRHLLKIWPTLTTDHELHIYGHQQLSWGDVKNVHWHGYVEDLKEAYDEHSIVLVPTFRVGGIKTKVLEAWAYGRPVLGNPLSFEGMNFPDYPLAIPEDEWPRWLDEPELSAAEFLDAAASGFQFLQERMTIKAYASGWRAIFREAVEHQP